MRRLEITPVSIGDPRREPFAFASSLDCPELVCLSRSRKRASKRSSRSFMARTSCAVAGAHRGSASARFSPEPVAHCPASMAISLEHHRMRFSLGVGASLFSRTSCENGVVSLV